MVYEALDSVLEPRPGGSDGLLRHSLEPRLSLQDLLGHLLRRALQLSASDWAAGLLTLPGSGFPASDCRVLALGHDSGSSRGELPDRRAVEAWVRRGGCELREPLLLGDLWGEDMSLRLHGESRSALLVPLTDERCSLGLLYVESRQPQHYSKTHIERLRSLASEAISPIYRLVLREHFRSCGSEMDLIGMSPALGNLERQILDAACYDQAPVLITGERGSGKELAAWALHVWSSRRARPFVPVLLAGLPDTLVVDELFGHERHSFTGAEDRRPGKFEAAGAGTVFLDEIGEITPALQTALLRIVERNELSRIGRDLPIRVDARVVAATNRDLHRAMREGLFREDLYDRLIVFEIRIPPLRERREDIPLLADYFLTRYCSELHRRAQIERLDVCRLCRSPLGVGCASPEFYETLAAYDWPGNIRELKHIIFRLAATVRGDVLQARHLPERFRQVSSPCHRQETSSWNLDAALRRHIEAALEATGNNKSRASRLLGIPYTTLQSKLKRMQNTGRLP